ncbi:Rieske (2Fe-2S) protein [Micromonospora halophytica]|uniref:Cytochrome bc1 complex Rieske iron-sulfur subunit n=1 Tax=Micromonospora halophytica TaxID=47864 RepID=A0A1C5IA11_9ACTN|nr:Rieske (2Fe-2S) protein [Micromonospora halophytica]SCG54959.1 Ferredoxin subunit of nitrite reductase or a ring-hydroxylating dioxygenase [Micromonospora halophytica]
MSDVDERHRPSRRAALACAGAAGAGVLLTGCQTYGEAAAPPAPAAPAAGGPPTASGRAAAPAGGAAAALATVADIPIGGGRVFAAEGVVVTQPEAGTIKAFSAKCTHAGCTVSEVRERAIVCRCHNSAFDIADGAVKGGPARQPLPAAGVTVEGDSVRLA